LGFRYGYLDKGLSMHMLVTKKAAAAEPAPKPTDAKAASAKPAPEPKKAADPVKKQ
jgi:hypothetical protein